MAYIFSSTDRSDLDYLVCRPNCTCGPCRSGHHALSEFYFRDEDREPASIKATNLGQVVGLGSTGKPSMPPKTPPRKTTVSERRRWKSSKVLLSQEDFGYIEQMLMEPSPFQRYFIDLHRTNPSTLFSNAARILPKNSFEQQYQKIYGEPPVPNAMGTVDKQNGRVYLRAFNDRLLLVDLESAVHEAVHLFSCPLRRQHNPFHINYGDIITEGFTQYVTEEILKSQKLKIVRPSTYADERVVAAKLIEVVGLQNLADEYFRCRDKVQHRLHRMGVLREFEKWRDETDKQRSAAVKQGKKPGYEKLLRFLERIKSSTVR